MSTFRDRMKELSTDDWRSPSLRIAAEADDRIAALEAENAELREVLKYARRMVKPSECDVAYIDAAITGAPK